MNEHKTAISLNLKQLLAEDQLEKVFEHLLELPDDQDADFQQQLMALADNHQELKAYSISENADPERLAKDRQNLRKGLLQLIDHWQKGSFYLAENISEAQLAETQKRAPIMDQKAGESVQAIFLKTADFRVAEKYFIIQGEALLGRSTECQVCINHPYVSRKHARVFVEKGKAFLEDLGSANGTFVDKTPLEEKLEIDHPTTIQLDEVVFTMSVMHGSLR